MSNKVAKNGGGDPATVHYQVLGNGAANTAFGNTAFPIPRMLYIMNNGNVHILDDSNTWITYAVTAGQTLNFRAQALGASTTANVVCWV